MPAPPVVRPACAVWSALSLALLATACTPASDYGASAPESAGVPRVEGDAFPRRVTRPDGRGFELAAPPSRVFAANAGVLDTVGQLIGAERVLGIGRGGAAYSVLLERGALELTPAQRALGVDSESVIGLAPDLLLMHSWQSLEQIEIFDASAVPWVALPDIERFEDLVLTVDLLGRLLGCEPEAQALSTDLERRRARLAEPAPHHGAGALAYSNDGTGGYVMGSGTTHDVVLDLSGLENRADDFDLDWHSGIGVEQLLAIDPQVLVVPGPSAAQEESPTAAFLASDERFAALQAVRDGRVIEVPALLFSTNSVFLMEAAEVVARELDGTFESPR